MSSSHPALLWHASSACVMAYWDLSASSNLYLLLLSLSIALTITHSLSPSLPFSGPTVSVTANSRYCLLLLCLFALLLLQWLWFYLCPLMRSCSLHDSLSFIHSFIDSLSRAILIHVSFLSFSFSPSLVLFSCLSHSLCPFFSFVPPLSVCPWQKYKQ